MGLKFAVARKIIQFGAVGLLLIPAWFPANAVWLGSYLSSRFFSIPLTDPLAVAEVMLAAREFIWPLIWSVLPLLVVSAILGRVFCGWICPLNTALELAALVKKPKRPEGGGNYGPYRLLAGFLFMSAIAGLPLFTMVSPIGIISRGLMFGAGLEIALVGVIIALEYIFSEKYWCRKLCPVGAFYGVSGYFRFLGIDLKENKCTHCGQCLERCSMGVKVGSDQSAKLMDCTNCGECIDVCRENAIRFAWKLPKKGGAVIHEPDTSAKR